MRAYEFLCENAPRTLYHGTLKSNLQSIMKGGLEPRIGAFTSHFYDPEEDDLAELVFASSRKDIQKGLNAIIHLLKQQGIPSTPENVIKYGAMVVVKDDYNEFEHRPYDDMNYWGDYPRQVEPGDFYSRENVGHSYILQDRKLKDLLRREGFDAWMGTKHPKLQNEAKYDYSLADYEATPYDPDFEFVGDELKQYNEPHIGPQEGKYLNLMLRGIKPATVIANKKEKEMFAPYIKKGTVIVAAKDDSEDDGYENWYVTLPGEEWRGKKLKQLFRDIQIVRDADPYDKKAEMTMDAKIGRLLGLPKESIKYFLKTRY